MSSGRYVLGVALMLGVVGSAAFGAHRLRRGILPDWSGAPARLTEVIIGLAIVLGPVEVLGALGLFRTVPVVVVVVGTGVAIGFGSGRLQPSHGRPPAPVSPSWAAGAALVGGALVLAHWGVGVNQAFHGGMLGNDTLAYHGPIAASYVQRHSIVHPPWVYSDPVVAAYPAGSELIHAIAILLFSRDVMSPLINVAWLTLALLSAWCVGRPLGLAPLALLSIAVILDLPVMSTSQPGSADNDIMALALLLASLALIFNAYPAADGESGRIPVPVVTVAGIAAGLSLGVKFSMVAVIALITVAMLVVLRGAWRRLAWILSVVAAGGIWYGRNAVAFGNPLPAVHLRVGPLALPSPRLPRSYSVADFLGLPGVWHNIFLPGVHWAFTFMWPLILGVALAGALLGVLLGRTRLDRLLGAVALVSTVIYAYTPRTADGPGVFFRFNLRYLLPAVLIGSILFLRIPRLNRILRHPAALAVSAAGLGVAVSEGPPASFALTAGVVAATGLALIVWLTISRRAWSTVSRRAGLTASRRARPGWIALMGFGAALILAWIPERTYLSTRYTGSGPFACELITCAPVGFLQSAHRARIALGGSIGPYLLYGLDLSNRVTVLGRRGPHGAWTPITSCTAWRAALADAHFDYVVTSGPFYLFSGPGAPQEADWTRTDPSATLLSTTPAAFGAPTSVFRIRGRSPPGSCAFRPRAAAT